ncbi:MAG: MerR family transcriptional regulator [Bacteroidales bacterium]
MENNLQREKLYYSIGEVAEMLGVQTSAVRYWEKEFDILKPRKNRKGNRLFTPADVENLKIISPSQG